MATQKKAPAKEPDPPKRPVMNYGPFSCDRNTSVEVAIWSNEVESDGRTFTTYNVTAKRSYRTESGEWKANQNYRPHDLPVLIHALQRAHAWILDAKTNGHPEE